MSLNAPFACVLFDLDGTLLDTAPDLMACLQEALTAHHHADSYQASAKPWVSFGALAMIQQCVPTLSAGEQQAILDTMLARYAQHIARHTVFFTGMDKVLVFLESHGIPWGIVTNKRRRFTEPLLRCLGLETRVVCAVSGDSTANPKPHTDPMLLACRLAGVAPEQCVYIGDALHDIVAGNNAQMYTLAAVYGYLKPCDNPLQWGANGLIASPDALLAWLQTRLE